MRNERRSTVVGRFREEGAVVFERRILAIFGALIVTILGGTIGFKIIEDWGWFDALYMTVITVTTVGFEEVRPLSDDGRWFAIAVIVFGVGTILFTITVISEYVISGQVGGLLSQKRMQRSINNLDGHFIVCGYGRTGQHVASELHAEHHRIVIVDRDAAAVAEAIAAGYKAVPGDAGRDEVLESAGVARAKGVVAAVAPDAMALMVVLTARSLNPELMIVARADEEESESKLRRAGADRVISIYRIAGHRLAQLVSRPNLTEFLDVVLHDREMELEMNEIALEENSPYQGVTLGESKLHERSGASIVGIRKHGGSLIVVSTAGTLLDSGDVLVALGTRQQLDALSSATVAAPSQGA